MSLMACILSKTRQLIGKQRCHKQNQAISSIAVADCLLFTAAFDNTIVCWDVKVGHAPLFTCTRV